MGFGRDVGDWCGRTFLAPMSDIDIKSMHNVSMCPWGTRSVLNGRGPQSCEKTVTCDIQFSGVHWNRNQVVAHFPTSLR